MTGSSAMLHSRFLNVVALAGALVLIALYVAEVISPETMSPEIGRTYRMLASIKTLPEALSKFLSVQEIWYRPLTFYVWIL